ncbi:hypothetical protein [Corynebacterium tapiri]|uniref:Uncharacterized protein n=1 Tax=Corynebacterium tapiri TaxID=1448266 RepID=A0A5C4U603_9CORY|nr:hypothetical protein [Corynebacterium tapiri]TNL99826.1 hypothetical protein FHE74_01975 [Corynebacterium tapiri]
MKTYLQTLITGPSELLHAFLSRREELMRGQPSQLWEMRRHAHRAYLVNVSRDIGVQEAWFTDEEGNRQALGRIRPGERAEMRSLRDSTNTVTSGKLEWRVRSMLLPGRSIWRSVNIHNCPIH